MNNIINSSGVYDITSYNLTSNNTTIFSTLNVSGTTTLNNVIINGSLNSTNFLNNNTTINGTLNVSGTTTLSNNTTINGTLNVSGKTLLNNNSTVVGTLNISGYTNIKSFLEVLEDISCNWITCASSAVIGNTIYCNNHTNNTGDTINFNILSSTNNYPSICTINSIETKINNSLHVSGITKLDNITTINSSLNVSGVTTLNHNTTCTSSLNVSGVTTLKNITTINSTLYVSGTTTLNNNTSVNSSLNVSGVTTLNNDTTLNGVLSLKSNTWHQSIDNFPRLFFSSGGSTFVGSGDGLVNDNGFVVVSSSAGGSSQNLVIKNNGNTSIRGSLNISGTTTLSNSVTCVSSLNVSGLSLLNRIATYNNTLPNLTAVNNSTTHSIINVFPGINGQQDALAADLYNIYLSSFAYGSSLSGPQPYITVNATMLYNLCNTKLTLQAYGYATTAGPQGAKIILNGGNNGGGSISFTNDSTTTCTMTTSGLNVNGDIDCSGGIALSGSNAFYNLTSVDPGNYSNTYLTLKANITNNDWCYFRQIGSDNTFKLALDFHDDGTDARFCIRNVQSTNNPDTITEVFTVDNGNVSCTGLISCNSISLSNACIVAGNVGIKNAYPWGDLNIGNCDVGGSSGHIVFGKNNAGGGVRNFKQGISSNFFFCTGDCGNVNNSSAVWTLAHSISYQAPASSFVLNGNGSIVMQYGYSTSDERVKTNIKTIENALEKTLLLRGVEYNDFRIEPDKKRIGLIAQEVELIVPEVVGENEMDKIKCISHGSLVGLLIEAIKEQQTQINELKHILKNNNLN